MSLFHWLFMKNKELYLKNIAQELCSKAFIEVKKKFVESK